MPQTYRFSWAGAHYHWYIHLKSILYIVLGSLSFLLWKTLLSMKVFPNFKVSLSAIVSPQKAGALPCLFSYLTRASIFRSENCSKRCCSSSVPTDLNAVNHVCAEHLFGKKTFCRSETAMGNTFKMLVVSLSIPHTGKHTTHRVL